MGKSVLFLCFFAVLPFYSQGIDPVAELTERLHHIKRSDDPNPLSAVVEQLIDRVSSLEASETALKARVTELEKKRCLSGKEAFTPHDENALITNGGHPIRTETHHVTFSPPFQSVPEVTLGFVYLDIIENGANERVRTYTQNLQAGGFDLLVEEWEDSFNYHVEVMWMACTN